jgi:hypothetical protein
MRAAVLERFGEPLVEAVLTLAGGGADQVLEVFAGGRG